MQTKEKPVIDCNKDVGVQRNLLLQEIIDDLLDSSIATCVCNDCWSKRRIAEYLSGKKAH